MFITFEGPDGVGKTTQTKMFVEYLRTNNLFQEKDIIHCREPGGTEISQKIRELFLETSDNSDKLTQVLLLLAAKNELIKNVIKPNLNKGNVVVCDRYTDSLIAYQSQTENLECWTTSIDNEILDSIKKLIFSSKNLSLSPNLTFFLTGKVDFMKNNIERRNNDTNVFDLKTKHFHENVNFIMKLISKNNKKFNVFPNRILSLIDNEEEKSIEEIHKTIVDQFHSFISVN